MANEWQDIKDATLSSSKDEWDDLSDVNLKAKGKKSAQQGFSASDMLKNLYSGTGEIVSNVAGELSPWTQKTGWKIPGGEMAKNLFMTAMGEPRRVEAVGQQMTEKYGGTENLLRTLQNKPADMLMDFSALTGVAGGAARVGGLSKTANILSKTSEYTNPLSAITKPIQGARALIGKTETPEVLYAKAMKMPPGSLREEARAKVLDTMVRDEDMPLSHGHFGESTVQKMNKIIGPLHEEIAKTLKGLPDETIEIDKVTNGIDKLKDRFKKRLDYPAIEKDLDEIKQKYIDHAFVNNGKITLSDAREMNTGSYENLEKYYSKKQMPETGRTGLKTDEQAIAEAEGVKILREEIMSNPSVPDNIKNMMKREAGLMNARKWVERATNRGGNIDTVSLSGMFFGVLVEAGMKGVMAHKIATSQWAMSRLATALAHGSSKAEFMGKIIRPVTAGTYEGQQFGGGRNVPSGTMDKLNEPFQ